LPKELTGLEEHFKFPKRVKPEIVDIYLDKRIFVHFEVKNTTFCIIDLGMIFWIRNLSHIATHLVLLIGATSSKMPKAPRFKLVKDVSSPWGAGGSEKKQCCCPRGKSLSSRILEDQFSSPCPCPRTRSHCPQLLHFYN